MNIVVIFNGLGNQMSQYAFFLAKKKFDKNCICIFDDKNKLNHNGYELNKLFGVSMSKGFKAKIAYHLYQFKKSNKYISRLLTLLGIRVISEDKNYLYRRNLVESKFLGINYFWGGWPSEKHFEFIKDEIKSVYKFPEQDDPVFLKWKYEITNNINSVSIHIRRGDYLMNTNDMYQFGGVANMKYFSKAMSFIMEKISCPTFYIFSDDIPWCKEQFKGDEFNFVDCNHGDNSWRDMYLMSLCHNHINSNSTFSWWAAWLSPYSDSLTISPKEYISNLYTPDVYPDNWIKIDNK